MTLAFHRPADPDAGARQRLPNRRRGVAETIEWQGQQVRACFGFDGQSRVREVFLDAAKRGTDLALLLDDVAVLASLLLQCGPSAGAVYASLGRVNPDPALPPAADAAPASLIGAILARAARLEREITTA